MSDLKAFILRSQVLGLYRQYLRLARQVPQPQRGELAAQVRAEFEAQRGVGEPYAKKFLLSDGRARLKQLEEMLGMQH